MDDSAAFGDAIAAVVTESIEDAKRHPHPDDPVIFDDSWPDADIIPSAAADALAHLLTDLASSNGDRTERNRRLRQPTE